MGPHTVISWTDRTWNPWQGCRKVSDGCRNCYMYRDQKHYGRDPNIVRRSAPATFLAPLVWSADKPLVFTCSWSDFFIEEADRWRASAWAIIRARPDLMFQILTKRPQNIIARLPSDWGKGYPNVWLGVSVEDQHRADERLSLLAPIPAAVRFASAEPLLGPIDVMPWLPDVRHNRCAAWDIPGHDDDPGCVDWLIIGGESGPDGVRRELDMDAARSLIRQCQEAGVATLVKQDSGPRPGMQGRFTDAEWALKQFPRIA